MLMFTDAFGTIGRRPEAVFATPDNATAAGAANVEDVRDVRAVDSLRALLRHVKEWIWRHAPTTAFEGDVRVETLKSGRANVHTTYFLAGGTSRQRILVGEDPVAACFKARTGALIGSGRTAPVAEHAAHTITEHVRPWTSAFIPFWDEGRVAVEPARIIGGASGRRVIRIVAILFVPGVIDQLGKINSNLIFTVFFGKDREFTVGLDSSW
jgi:hypothetical protein